MVDSAFACQGHHHDKAPQIADAIVRLKSSGYKMTRPRQLLIDAMAHLHGPFSADDLYMQANKQTNKQTSHGKPEAKLDLVTVYRTLATLTELGIIARVDLGDSISRYELRDPEGSHHHHVICRSCERIEPLDLCQVESLERRLEEMGYSGLSHRLEFFGLCPKCSKAQG